MEADHGKLFIGGISWETDENGLKEYFGQFGEVMEAEIMRDRITGRARGFGFIVYADPAVAERIVMEKHVIDGRTVEAKKAVPRVDHQILSKSSNSIQGSPGPGRTKKIFVGGLASAVTESDFKKYFEDFGNITDAVVMFDNNTQRPRGFGFITYDSEDAVDKVLHKTFHELKGKMVEVKRAVPKELTPSPSHSPFVGYNYSNSRASNFSDNYAHGYSPSNIGEYSRLNSLVNGGSGLPPLANLEYGMGMGLPGMNVGYGSYLSNNTNHGRILGPYHSDNSNRYNSTPIGYNRGSERGESLGILEALNLRRNGLFSNPPNPTSLGAFTGFGSRNFGNSFGDGESNWLASPATAHIRGNSSGYSNRNLGNGFGDNSYGLGNGDYERSYVREPTQASSFSVSTRGFDTSYGGPQRSGSVYGDSAWPSGSSDLDSTTPFGFVIGNTSGGVASKTTEGFIGNSVTNRQANRGIAA